MSSIEAKKEFAHRLHRAIQERGWNQSDLAREASKHMPNDAVIGRDKVSHWLNRPSIPQSVALQAVCAALNMESTELVPTLGLPRAEVGRPRAPAGQVSPIEVEVGDDDTWYLRINTHLPYDIALEVQRLVFEGRKRLKHG